MPTHSASWQPSPHVSASTHHHGIVFFHAGQGQLFTSNRAGAMIWQGLERGLSADDIAGELSSHYQVSAVATRAHTSRFIAQLENHRLIARRAM